ncbi:MAG: hypothetical protein JSS61_00380 [Verrucomicrobia bacterium]|nr:hypothetical protein [Verrucomicrobiota bacterium]
MASESVPEKIYNQSDRCEVKRGFGPTAYADMLYWTATSDGWNVGIVDHAPSSTTPTRSARVKEIDPKWEFGWRVGLGWDLSYDGWDLDLNWTHFGDKASENVHIDPSKKTFFPSRSLPSALMNTASGAKSSWHLHFDTLDFSFGRAFQVDKSFSIRPSMGLRAARIQQSLKVNYENVVSLLNQQLGLPSPIPTLHVYEDNDFWGLGILAGLDTRWVLCKHFNLYADAMGSLLWGDFDQSNKTHSESQTFVHMKDDYQAIRGNLDLAAGFLWDWYLAKRRVYLALNVGYEYHIWFNQNQFDTFDNVLAGGNFYKEASNLSLTGLVLGMRLKF